MKATRSADLNRSITEAARIKAEKLPYLQKALELFNLKSETEITDLNDRIIALDVISEEPKAAIFAGSSENTRWAWIKAQVVAKKEALKIQSS